MLDQETGLVWDRGPSGNTVQWEVAVILCGDLATGGRFGWRLPRLEELMSLMDTSTFGLPTGHPFTVTTTESYWTATTVTTNAGPETSLAKTYLVAEGRGVEAKALLRRYWCVRGGTGLDQQ